MNYFLLIYFLILPFYLFAQSENTKDIDPDKLIQDLLRQDDLPDNYEEVFDVLYQYFLTPLDLNKASREDLEGLYILSPEEVNAFFEHKNKYGPFLSLYELQAIEGWQLSTIRKIGPFVVMGARFDKARFAQRLLHNPNHFLLFRTDRTEEKRKGYLPGENGKKMYQGSPYKHLLRYRNSIGRDFSIGCTMEKDAGEQIIWNPSQKQYLMDYISFHACLFNKGKWKAIGLGDYKLQFGQGLVFGGGFYMGKSAETILAVKRNSRGVLPYSSVLETDFFRGICLTYTLSKKTEITGFYSNNNRDASLQYDTLDRQYITTSLDDYGMHRTTKEIAAKRNLNEQAAGGNISVHSRNQKLHGGISGVYTLYSKMMQETDRIYNRFDFSGKDNLVMSADYSYVFQNFNLFGEGAMCSGGGKALVLGGISSFSSKIDFSFLYRNYDKNFHSFYANAFGESSTASNEKGCYWGIRIKPHGKWLLSAYYDHFVFPWLKYQKDNPTEGYGYLGRLQYSPSKKIILYIQLRYEEAGKNQSDNITPIDYTMPASKYNFMYNLDCNAGIITLRNRVQWSRYRQSNAPTRGFTLAQDLTVDLRKVKISTRYCLFDTDDYDNRQYVYEKDVLYTVSFPAYNGKGIRTYLVFQFKTSKRTDLWIRYAATKYLDQTSIGSGWDEIKGDKLHEWKLQLRYRFK